jgi:DNA-binding transcriptional MerR regulator
MYTVKRLADLAGVSRRTLQYYDGIGLLKADSRTASDYRKYGEDSLYRLQQILLFKEMGMDLKSIGSILECPSCHEGLPEFMRKAIGIYVSARES